MSFAAKPFVLLLNEFVVDFVIDSVWKLLDTCLYFRLH
jgi:hypothetical protein